jgi:hypothetical protein
VPVVSRNSDSSRSITASPIKHNYVNLEQKQKLIGSEMMKDAVHAQTYPEKFYKIATVVSDNQGWSNVFETNFVGSKFNKDNKMLT